MNRDRQALTWLLEQHPEHRVHLRNMGIHWGNNLQGWVYQRGYPSYEVLLTTYDDWLRFVISRSGGVYAAGVAGEPYVAEREPLWRPGR